MGNLAEVLLLQKLAARREKADPVKYKDEINVYCRGAIVLLSAHLEGYLKNLGELTLISLHAKQTPRNKLVSQFFYHLSKDFIDEIKDTSDPSKIAKKVFDFLAKDQQYWNVVGPFPNPLPIEQFNKGFAAPKFENIKSYFNRFGYTEYHTELARQLRAKFAPAKNMVDHLVDTRNKIAHGDPNMSKTPSDISDMLKLIKLFGRMTDRVFANWSKKNLCAIK